MIVKFTFFVHSRIGDVARNGIGVIGEARRGRRRMRRKGRRGPRRQARPRGLIPTLASVTHMLSVSQTLDANATTNISN